MQLSKKLDSFDFFEKLGDNKLFFYTVKKVCFLRKFASPKSVQF